MHLDGYNLMPFFKRKLKESPRQEFLYWSDDGDLFAIRIRNWKISFISYTRVLLSGITTTPGFVRRTFVT